MISPTQNTFSISDPTGRNVSQVHCLGMRAIAEGFLKTRSELQAEEKLRQHSGDKETQNEVVDRKKRFCLRNV